MKLTPKWKRDVRRGILRRAIDLEISFLITHFVLPFRAGHQNPP